MNKLTILLFPIALIISVLGDSTTYADKPIWGSECRVIDINSKQSETEEANQAMVVEIYFLFEQWRKAVDEGNAKKVSLLVTEDAEFWPQGGNPIRGRSALEAAFKPFLLKYEFIQNYECIELSIRENIAFVRGIEHNTKIPRNGGKAITTRQRAFSVVRRTSEGKWLFARGMTNLEAEVN